MFKEEIIHDEFNNLFESRTSPTFSVRTGLIFRTTGPGRFTRLDFAKNSNGYWPGQNVRGPWILERGISIPTDSSTMIKKSFDNFAAPFPPNCNICHAFIPRMNENCTDTSSANKNIVEILSARKISILIACSLRVTFIITLISDFSFLRMTSVINVTCQSNRLIRSLRNNLTFVTVLMRATTMTRVARRTRVLLIICLKLLPCPTFRIYFCLKQDFDIANISRHNGVKSNISCEL